MAKKTPRRKRKPNTLDAIAGADAIAILRILADRDKRTSKKHSIGGQKTGPQFRRRSGTSGSSKQSPHLKACPSVAQLCWNPGCRVREYVNFYSASVPTPTHRVVFHFDVDADTVTILRVRHHGQDEL